MNIIDAGNIIYSKIKEMYEIDEDKFPYKRNDYTDDMVRQMFKNLQRVNFNGNAYNNYRQQIKKYNIRNIKANTINPKNYLSYEGKQLLLIHRPEDYKDIDLLSDMFQEHNRMLCRWKNNLSPYEYFIKNKEHIYNKVTEKGDTLSNYNVREEIYNSIKECSSFKPVNLVYFIKKYKVKSIFDPSSGWGDRLIAAMSQDVEYTGVDPNTLLFPVYQQMIEFFVPPDNRNKYKMINSRIQDVKMDTRKKYDLVFTSPPYFDLEKYTGAGLVTDENENMWVETFLKPMITITSSIIKKNGHLILVINQQSPRQTYIKQMFDFIRNTKILNLQFKGTISYCNIKCSNPQPMFIWTKI